MSFTNKIVTVKFLHTEVSFLDENPHSLSLQANFGPVALGTKDYWRISGPQNKRTPVYLQQVCYVVWSSERKQTQRPTGTGVWSKPLRVFGVVKPSIPGVSKGCCLEVLKYLRASKKHGTFVPGIEVSLKPWVLKPEEFRWLWTTEGSPCLLLRDDRPRQQLYGSQVWTSSQVGQVQPS